MAIQSRRNQYRGINAHLHSVLQNEPSDWPVFHSAHVVDLARAIDARLPAGYVVAPEKSLQIRAFDEDSGVRLPGHRAMRPDICIYQSGPAGSATMPAAALTPPTLTLTLEAPDDPENYYTAAVIYEVGQGATLGKPVARLELLSPTNKLPAAGYGQYREKRGIALATGIVMVEIDYLHCSRPVHDQVPSYPDREANAHAYHITLTDPRPNLKDSLLQYYGFGVDDSLPVIAIPLSGPDVVNVDFGAVCQQTYHSLGFYSYRVHYEAEPPQMDTYSPSDQARIRARMRAISAAQRQSLDLEQGPFPLIEAQGVS